MPKYTGTSLICIRTTRPRLKFTEKTITLANNLLFTKMTVNEAERSAAVTDWNLGSSIISATSLNGEALLARRRDADIN